MSTFAEQNLLSINIPNMGERLSEKGDLGTLHYLQRTPKAIYPGQKSLRTPIQLHSQRRSNTSGREQTFVTGVHGKDGKKLLEEYPNKDAIKGLHGELMTNITVC